MRQLGIFQVLLSGFCFGFLGLFGKKAYALGLRPGEFLAFRFLLAALALGGFFLLRNPGSLAIGRKNAVRAFALGACGYSLFSSFYFTALEGLSVSLTVLLLYLYPIWVTVGARFFLKEYLTPWHLVALPLALAGLLLLLAGEIQVRSPISLAFGLGASVFYSAYILCSRKLLSQAEPFPAAFYVMLGAACTLAFLHVRPLPAEPAAWLILSATSLVSTILAISLFLAGLQKLSGAEVSMLSLAEPCTAVLLGLIFFGERLSPTQWAGASLILGGMLLVALAKRAPSP
jgi:drug/metabolite transporter (DMT)-like permease